MKTHRGEGVIEQSNYFDFVLVVAQQLVDCVTAEILERVEGCSYSTCIKNICLK